MERLERCREEEYLAKLFAPSAEVPTRIVDLLRDLAPQVLAAVVTAVRGLRAAEDAVQEALLAAATQWPRDGVPDEPARLAHPGRVSAADRPVAERPRSRPDARSPAASARSHRDERPRTGRHAVLLFMCCHPGAHAGLGDRAHTARRRRAHHGRDRERVPRPRGDDGPADQPREADDQGVRRAVPDCRPEERAGAPARGAARALSDLQRGLREHAAGPSSSAPSSSSEAIRLARARARLLPDDAEVDGAAGADAAHRCPPAARGPSPAASWSRSRAGPVAAGTAALIAEGIALLDQALARRAGRASTSSRRRSPRCTTRPRRAEETDWPQILALYGLLERMTDNPMVTLNRAVAAAMVDGPAAGLAVLDGLDERARRPLPPGRGARPPARDGRRRPRPHASTTVAAAHAQRACREQ